MKKISQMDEALELTGEEYATVLQGGVNKKTKVNQIGGSVVYSVKTAAFTAEANKAYAVDTTSGSFNVTIDASLPVGKVIWFVDAKGTWNTHPPTFLRNGHLIEGVEIDYVDAAQGTFFMVVNVGGTTGLRILESGAKPHILTPPTITGHFTGVPITSSNGVWTGSPTSFSYQWQLSNDGSTGWTNIDGATLASFAPDSNLESKFVRSAVTATNSNGSSTPASSNVSEALSVPSFPTGAIAYWRLDSSEADITGNGRNLSNVNSVGYVAGKIGNAASFPGDLSIVLSTDAIFPGLAELTIVAWIKPTSGSPEGPFISQWRYDGVVGQLTANPDGGKFSYYTQQFDPISSISDLTIDAWNFVAYRFKGGVKQSVSVNGNAVDNEAPVTELTLRDGTSPFVIGANDSYPYTGLVDEVGVWNRYLSDAEIMQLFNFGNDLTYSA